MNTYQPFQKAVPIWAEGLEKEINITCGFYAKVKKKEGSQYLLKAAVSSFYRLFINGKFIYHGPSRCAHDYYRVDELDVTAHLTEGENSIAIEAVGYNVNSFYSLDQPSFLQESCLRMVIPLWQQHQRADLPLFSCGSVGRRCSATAISGQLPRATS